MKFRVGDKVLFLNEKGGGFVSRIVDEQIIQVAVEDGFEIPYAIKDLILEDGQDRDAVFERPRPRARISSEKTGAIRIDPSQDSPAAGIYLSMVPRDQNEVLIGSLDFYLVNHTDYCLHFGLMLNKSGNYEGLIHDQMPEGSSFHLGKVERNEISDWGHSQIHFLFFKKGQAKMYPPGSEHIVFKQIQTYKETSFVFDSFLQQKAMVINVVDLASYSADKKESLPDVPEFKRLQDHFVAGPTATAQPVVKAGFLEKHKVDDKIAEIDLHIHNLTDDTTNLSNADLLGLQMDYFHRAMKEAQKEKIRKLIFIHGVGQGTLKNEIIRFLGKTEGVNFYDAPYARYGMGATEVVFYRHRQ